MTRNPRIVVFTVLVASILPVFRRAAPHQHLLWAVWHASYERGLAPAPPPLTNLYISNSGGGSGTSCGSPEPYSYFNTSGNWGSGGPIGPGTTVHLCSETNTFSANAGIALTFQGSGTSGNLIALAADQGPTVLQAPYWGTGGAISSGNQSYIIINGDHNLTIQNTANGSAQANQGDSTGIDMRNCSNCAVENTSILNMYLYASYATVTGCSWSSGTATCALAASCPFVSGLQVYVGGVSPSGYSVGNVTLSSCSGSSLSFPVPSNPGTYASGGQVADEGGSNTPGASLIDVYGIRIGTATTANYSNFTISGNTITWSNRAIQVAVPGGATVSGTNAISGNVLGYDQHGLDFLSGNMSATLAGTNSIYTNTFHDMGVWADGSVFDGNHGDYIQIGPVHTGASFGSNTVVIYSNYFYGAIGANGNALIYLTGTGLTFSGAAIFNNVAVFSDTLYTPACGIICDIVQSAVIVNNTLVGGTNSLSASGSHTCIHAYDNPGQVNVTIENNVCATVGIAIDLGTSGGGILASDYNDLYNVATSGFGGVGIDNTNTLYATLASWQGCNTNGCPTGTAPTHDTNSMIGNPLLNALNLPPYQALSGSPIFGAGTNLTSLGISALDTDAAGNARSATGAWDVGAYQGIITVLPPLNLSLSAH